MNKTELVNHLRDILDNDLDDVLQGNYSKRNKILAKFDALIDEIEAYKNKGE